MAAPLLLIGAVVVIGIIALSGKSKASSGGAAPGTTLGCAEQLTDALIKHADHPKAGEIIAALPPTGNQELELKVAACVFKPGSFDIDPKKLKGCRPLILQTISAALANASKSELNEFAAQLKALVPQLHLHECLETLAASKSGGAPGQSTGTPPILPQPLPQPGGFPSLSEIGEFLGGLIPKPGQTPPIFPGFGGSSEPVPEVLFEPCLDASMTAEERANAIEAIKFTLAEWEIGEEGNTRESFAAFLDEAAADAANSGKPQFAFCMLAKAANIRAGGDGLPHLEDGALKF